VSAACLSLEDRAEILDLYATYPYRWDSGDAEGWPQLFTPDCELRRPGYEPIRGRDGLRALVLERRRTMPGTTHHTNNVLLEPVAEGVRGRAYVIALRSTQQDPVRLRDVGTYEDLVVRHEGAWRFRFREFVLGMPPYQQDAEVSLVPKDRSQPGAAEGLERRVAELERLVARLRRDRD
jgi:SnoaL-like domain